MGELIIPGIAAESDEICCITSQRVHLARLVTKNTNVQAPRAKPLVAIAFIAASLTTHPIQGVMA